jgi:hypothetical protein
MLKVMRVSLLMMAAGILIWTAIAYEPEVATPAILFLVACVAGIAVASRQLGVLSWSMGIPIFYVAFFLVMPLIGRLLGDVDGSQDPLLARAFYIAAAGMTAYSVGLVATKVLSEPRDLNVLGMADLHFNRSAVSLLAAIGTVAILWSYAFGYFGLVQTTDAGDSAGIVSAMTFLLTLAHAMAWCAYFQGKTSRWFGITTTLIFCAMGIISNSKGMMLVPFLYIALASWGAYGRFPYKFAVAILGLYVFVAFPFVTASRFVEFTGTRLEFADLAIESLVSMRWAEDSAALSALASLDRGLFAYFTDIVSQTGTVVPFMEGRTFSEGLQGALPRLLYPEKPDLSIGNWTAKAFGVIDVQDDITNLSPTYMGEFYMNFGLVGVCFGMCMLAVLAVLVDRYVIVTRRSWVMPIMVSFVVWQESFVGHTIIPFVKNAFVWLPLLLLIAYATNGIRRANGRKSSQLQT